MNIDDIIYRNMMHLLEKNGIPEQLCLSCCELNHTFFLNYRKGITKHFRICDLIKIACFFEVSMDYLCQYKNTSDSFFIPKFKLRKRDEKIMLSAFKKLDPVSRIAVTDFLYKETQISRERIKSEQLEKRLVKKQ